MLISWLVLIICWLMIMILLVESSKFSLYKVISSIETILLISFHLDDFYFLFLSIFMVLTSNTVLNRHSESRHHCLSDLRWKAFNLSPLSVILCMGLSNMAFIIFRYFSFIPKIFLFIIMNGYCIFLKMFFYICWDDHMILSFIL